MKIFIPGNCPSSKNSRPIFNGRLCPNKTVVAYEGATKKYWLEHAKAFRELYDSMPKPVRVSFQFIRDSKRRFDYHNIVQEPCDLMTRFGWIEDDDSLHLVPVFVEGSVDKENPGIWIEL